MKKRILSGILTLAMILTMLPMTVFAASATPYKVHLVQNDAGDSLKTEYRLSSDSTYYTLNLNTSNSNEQYYEVPASKSDDPYYGISNDTTVLKFTVSSNQENYQLQTSTTKDGTYTEQTFGTDIKVTSDLYVKVVKKTTEPDLTLTSVTVDSDKATEADGEYTATVTATAKDVNEEKVVKVAATATDTSNTKVTYQVGDAEAVENLDELKLEAKETKVTIIVTSTTDKTKSASYPLTITYDCNAALKEVVNAKVEELEKYSWATIATDLTVDLTQLTKADMEEAVMAKLKEIFADADSSMKYAVETVAFTAPTYEKAGSYVFNITVSMTHKTTGDKVEATIKEKTIDLKLADHEITIEANENQGTVEINVTDKNDKGNYIAKAGQPITVSIKPKDEKVEVSTVRVSYKNGEEDVVVATEKNDDGTYTFSMPNADVTITVTFATVFVPESKPTEDKPLVSVTEEEITEIGKALDDLINATQDDKDEEGNQTTDAVPELKIDITSDGDTKLETTHFELPAALITMLNDKIGTGNGGTGETPKTENLSITIKTDIGEVKIDKEVLSKLGSDATQGATLKVEKKDVQDVKDLPEGAKEPVEGSKSVEVKFETHDGNEIEMQSTKLTLTLNFGKVPNFNKKNMHIGYVSSKNKTGFVDNILGHHFLDGNLNVTFDVSHLTEFYVAKRDDVFTITLDANGGTLSSDSSVLYTNAAGKITDSLPTPTRDDYTFDGWYTAKDGGDKVTSDTVFKADTTLYAHWTKKSGGNSTGGGSYGGGGSYTSGSTNKPSTGTGSNTVTNPDGSTTTSVTNKDGSITETTKHTDGTEVVKQTAKDGSMTITETRSNGTEIKTEINQKGEVSAVVSMPKGLSSVTVTIPTAEKPTVSTVAVIVYEDGTREIVKTCLPGEDGMIVKLSKGAKLEIVDNTKHFTDVDDSFWGQEAIAFTSARELFTGMTETTYEPNATMTRAMLMTVLARLDGEDTSYTNPALWYENAMNWAVRAGISDGSDPNGSITREQLATMLYRYFGQPKTSNSTNAFPDSNSVSSWATDAMNWAVEQGIIQGMDTGTLDPQGNATRAQVATMLMRFINAMA